MTTDEKYMWRCLQLSRCGIYGARPNPMVGAVIVAHDRIIGEGYHRCYGEAHAEVNAFASVRDEDAHLLTEATIYVSLEPCAHWGHTPPCADLIIRKGVKRCVVGCRDSFEKVDGRGIQRIREAGIEVTVGVLEEECRQNNRFFFTYHNLHRPFITLKWAQTANGFIDDNGHALVISTPLTRIISHKLRSEADAMLVGRTTEERENPQLSNRYWGGTSPKKYVLSSTIYGKTGALDALMQQLYADGVEHLVVEGGLKTLQSFLDSNLFDEIRVEASPRCVSQGTHSPLPPSNIRQTESAQIDGNTITFYRRIES